MPIDLVDAIGGAAIPRVRIERREGGGWHHAESLADGRALEEPFALLRQWTGVENSTVPSALLLDSYVWGLSGACAAALLLEGVLPDLGPGSVAVRFSPVGRIDAVSFRPGAELSATPEVYGHALVEHLRPLVDRLAARSRRAPNAFWRSAGDMTAWTLAWCGRALDDAERARALLAELFTVSSALGPERRFTTTADGKIVCLRRGCCLWLRTADGSTCAGCPVAHRRAARGAADPVSTGP